MTNADAVPYALAHAAQLKARRHARRRRPAPAAPAADPLRSASQQAGDRAEAQACAYLEAAGLVTVMRNLACRAGEIDLIMRDGPVLVFVEVRSRAAGRHGGAAASVGRDKQRRLVRTARHFLQARWRGPVPPCRFDVVAVDAGQTTWIRAAFTE